MKRRFMQVAAMCLAAVLWMGMIVPAQRAKAVQSDPIVRIGLAYGNNALPSANLENSVGSGYRFGYFDENRTFVSLASTNKTKITVLKTQNLYLRNGSYTDTVPGGDYTAIGCYHIELPGSYDDFASAQRAANAIPGGFPAYITGTFTVRVGAYVNRAAAENAQAQLNIANTSIKGTSTNGVSVVETGTANIILQFDGGSSRSLGIMPGQDNSVKTVTWFKGFKYYGGFQYERIHGNLNVVNFVPLEDYVKGVIPYEMSRSWPVEALKAQAVCARNYVMLHQNKHSAYHFDLCNGTDCQTYRGLNSADSTTDAAVDETAGIYARYDGKLADLYYASSDGGATEDVYNVWGSNYAYLKGVSDPHEALVRDQIPSYAWTVTFTAEELTTLLNSKGYSCGTIASFRITERSAMGNVIAITLTDVNGRELYFSRSRVSTTFNLRSMRYNVAVNGGGGNSGGYAVTGGTVPDLNGLYAMTGKGSLAAVSGAVPYAVTKDGTAAVQTGSGNGGAGTSFTISGTGYGHQIGMSQWGAYSMAKQGYTYEDILHFYFTGITVGV